MKNMVQSASFLSSNFPKAIISYCPLDLMVHFFWMRLVLGDTLFLLMCLHYFTIKTNLVWGHWIHKTTKLLKQKNMFNEHSTVVNVGGNLHMLIIINIDSLEFALGLSGVYTNLTMNITPMEDFLIFYLCSATWFIKKTESYFQYWVPHFPQFERQFSVFWWNSFRI